MAGFPFLNWLLAPLIAATLFSLLRGAWSIAAALTLAALLFRAHLWLRMRRDFVHFTAPPTGDPLVDSPHTILDPSDKLPIHVTGCLEVGGKVQRFTFLPGFYRTFATREHALLCLCRGGRKALLGSWPEAETGVWYAFFHPHAIRKVERGTLHFGSLRSDALAIEIDAAPTRGRIRRKAIETLYLAADPATLDRIRRDLTADAPAQATSTPSHPVITTIKHAAHPPDQQYRS